MAPQAATNGVVVCHLGGCDLLLFGEVEKLARALPNIAYDIIWDAVVDDAHEANVLAGAGNLARDGRLLLGRSRVNRREVDHWYHIGSRSQRANREAGRLARAQGEHSSRKLCGPFPPNSDQPRRGKVLCRWALFYATTLLPYHVPTQEPAVEKARGTATTLSVTPRAPGARHLGCVPKYTRVLSSNGSRVPHGGEFTRNSAGQPRHGFTYLLTRFPSLVWPRFEASGRAT